MIQSSRIRGISDDFSDAIVGDLKELRFPNDSYPAWEYIVVWIMDGSLDRETFCTDPQYLAEAWNIAARFGVPKLQDDIMVKLLKQFNKLGSQIDAKTIKAVFKGGNAGWSELKELAVEEAVKCFYHYKVDPAEFELQKCDTIPGFMLAVTRAYRRFVNNPKLILSRFEKEEGHERARWEDFLVDGGLGTMFQFNQVGKYRPKKRTWSMVEQDRGPYE